MKMFASERRNKIMAILLEKQRLTVKELATNINVSEATLRTDLSKMEFEGLLTRTHGGAVLNEYAEIETSFSVREKKNKNEKIKIAEKAFTFIKEKQCILLDASSTALELARYLRRQYIPLTVVTSGVQTALELKENLDINVILIGGMITKGSTSIEGTLGLSILDHLNIDIMFTSANGFTHESGLTDFNLYEVQLKKELVNRSKMVIALIDNTKIGTNSSAVFARTSQIDTLITNELLDQSLHKALVKCNVNVVF